MIDLSRTTSTAVEHLKNYLEFAEHGVSALAAIRIAEHGIDQFDSPFEEMVAQQLRDKGWKVQTQVGVSKFRIDLGVIHPTEPGRFIAGVECDGRTYHGSATARDRDRVRQIILEGLGWKIIRIWSTEYFQEPLRVIDQVDFKLRKLLEVESSFDKETTESSQEFTKQVEVVDNQLNNEFDDDGDLVPNYSDIESYSVRLGSSVKIRYVSGHMEGEEMTFKVVSEGAELIKTASYREVPINAPVIQVLLDKIVGDEASYKTPSGDHRVLVVEVIH
jgi:very-short-patch-repair endonuclease